MSLVSVGKRIFGVLDFSERRRAYALLPLVTIRAVLDTVGVATVLPFIAVVADPADALSNRYLGSIYRGLGFERMDRFLILLGVAALLTLVVSNAVAVATEYLVKRFVQRQSHILQGRLMYRNLAQPYAAFLAAHSGEVGQSILSEVRQFVDGMLLPLLQMVARMITAVVILVLLLIVDPVLAITTSAALACVYLLISQIVRRVLNRIGRERRAADTTRYRTVTETYGGIKDVKIAGREKTFLDRFTKAAKRHAGLEVVLHVTKVAPKSLLEVVAFSGIIGIILYLLSTGRSTTTVISIVTLYAFACYRLIPAVQQIYEATSTLRYSLPALELIERDAAIPAEAPSSFERPSPQGMEQNISFKDVTFYYPGAETPSLVGLNVSIQRGTTTAIVGATGSGKTTALDILLRLLDPTSGEVLVDGVPLAGDRVRSWQAAVGYVPQHVFLSDDTVERNIAFGVPQSEIDEGAVHRAAHIAQIHDLIIGLPDRYRTKVGERGLRLSGGQRQRLGIARALYRDPEVLVLDEATSALDSVTEDDVFSSVAMLAGEKTLIIVTHRLSTVRHCDQIVLLENGRLSAVGDYGSLMESSVTFRAMAHLQTREDQHAAV